MTRAVNDGRVEQDEGEPVIDGVTFIANGTDPPLACIDGEEPDGCAEADHDGPLNTAPIPRGEVCFVVGWVRQASSCSRSS
jgi:hypothetical protein